MFQDQWGTCGPGFGWLDDVIRRVTRYCNCRLHRGINMCRNFRQSLAALMAAILLFSASAQSQDRQQHETAIPAPLQKAIEARDPQRWQTAKIEWMMIDTSMENQPAQARFYGWQCAGASTLAVERGDEFGVVVRESNGEPAVDGVHEHRSLRNEAEFWKYDGSLIARVRPNQRQEELPISDWRTIGVCPIAPTWSRSKLEATWVNVKRSYRCSRDGGLHVVEETLGDSGHSCKYWIDQDTDWSVIKTEAYDGGSVVTTTEFGVQLIDGIWLPTVIVTRNGAGRILRKFEILSAEIDRPDHPAALTPAHLQMEAGTNVFLDGVPGLPRVWDGKQLVAAEEYQQRLQKGTATLSPAIAREIRRRSYFAEIEPSGGLEPVDAGQARLANPSSAFQAELESEWERYVRGFIAKYALNDEQAERCLGILRACQDQAHEYLDRHRGEIDRLERDLRERFPQGAAAQPPVSAPARADGSTSPEAALLVRRAEILAPIHDIFENKLKPRLQRIPTRSQRASVEAAATTQPGSEP